MDQREWTSFWIGLAVFLVAAHFAWKKGFFRALSRQVPSPIRWWDVFFAFFIFYFLQIVLIQSAQKGMEPSVSSLSERIFFFGWVYLSIVVLILGVLLLYVTLLPQKKREWLFHLDSKERHDSRSFFVGIVSWFLAYPLVLWVSQGIGLLVETLYPHPRFEQDVVQNLEQLRAFPLLFWTTGFVISTCVPLLEEIIFRGFLQNGLGSFLGWKGRIATTALFFALLHYSPMQGIENGEILCSIFLFSLFLGYLYEREKTLWAPVGLHMMFNLMSFLFFVILQGGKIP